MTDTTVIPTPASPDVCSMSLLIDGSEVSGAFSVLSASVSNELNRIPSASVQLLDGEASKQTFAASDTDHFVPGKEIEIKLGYRGDTETVFKGIIVKHCVRIRRNGTRLSLECRDKTVRMTRSSRSRYFTDTKDSEILDDLLDEYQLDGDVATTRPSLKEVVQYDATDWDFLICRAEANGHVVAVRDGTVTIGPPSTSAEPKVTATFGTTVLELDAEIDARWQVPGVKATAWSATDQELVEAEASEPSVTASGNLSASDLSDVFGGDAQLVRHGGKLSEPELQAWADGLLLKGRLAKVRGRVRFQGFAGVSAGDVVEVAGIGERLAGRQLVAGVRHSFSDGNWETDVSFGLSPEPYAVTYPVTATPAGGLVPSVNGLQIGIVTALNDPDGEGRIKVRMPLVSTSQDGVWARLATLDAGDGRGTYFRPEVDDEVVVGFFDSDPRFPVVLGQVHSTAKPAPEAATDANDRKGYVSRSKLKLAFDDDKKLVVLETPAGNRLSLSEDGKKVVLEDQNGSSITLDDGGITLKSAKDITLKASGDVKVEGTKVQITGQNVKAQGRSGTDITSSGTLTLKGSVVQIN
ncbi:type VI secretion system tip protein VgrG [Cellulomonas sp. URHE0023]|uniref:type VI secretion system tip protein VgrG n=1 Tax=Cellulomonas sp. URHE0023 TaxID=1380354 RepID=UPI000488F455|nr:type VI secretion system tip protein VgrG [Cellulomonas sp. URHE0023]